MTDKGDKDSPPDDGRTELSPNPGLISGSRPKTNPKSGTTSGKIKSAPKAVRRKGRIQTGDVLNHIFAVRRFIARGGMGEVFEGVNVNTDERVAIKVILPHLAADPAIQAMFRKEARTLTRISHPGLVQYRVLAQEPLLDVFYIVTEYIDGPSLSERLATLEPTPAQLRGLLLKLAEGLAAAHALGAIHRDISPDNVMLADGRLERAKIIDFGIAKDLDPESRTIIGDGFAGKLSYIAPEQLGDFGRNIGPWTDVYSLGLTMMAVVLGRDVKMGTSLAEAFDKRRSGVDLTAAPDEIRDVLAAMLKADPSERLRSMEDVLQMLAPAPPPSRTEHSLGSEDPATGGVDAGRDGGEPPDGANKRRLALWGGGATLLLAAIFGIIMLGRDEAPQASAPPASTISKGSPADSLDREDLARRAVGSELRTLACSWLDIAGVSDQGGKVSLAVRGVSGKIPQALERIRGALTSVGIDEATVDFSDVSPISANTCGPIEAFVLVRTEGPSKLAVAQRKFEMNTLPADRGAEAGKPGAEAVFTLDLQGFDGDLSLVGIDESGEMVQLAPTQREVIANSKDLGDRRYRFSFFTTHSGWSGILLLTGKGPFDQTLLTSRAGLRSRDWEERFLRLARERNWKSEMVWYRTVDEQPNTP